MTDRMPDEQIAELAEMQPGTPGPWVESDGPALHPDYVTIRSADRLAWDGFCNVCVRMEGGTSDDPEGRANLALIAAAPEAFDALRQTRADLAQANATIAEKDAENARLRTALAFYAQAENWSDAAFRQTGPSEMTLDTSTAVKDGGQVARTALKETKHDYA